MASIPQKQGRIGREGAWNFQLQDGDEAVDNLLPHEGIYLNVVHSMPDPPVVSMTPSALETELERQVEELPTFITEYSTEPEEPDELKASKVPTQPKVPMQPMEPKKPKELKDPRRKSRQRHSVIHLKRLRVSQRANKWRHKHVNKNSWAPTSTLANMPSDNVPSKTTSAPAPSAIPIHTLSSTSMPESGAFVSQMPPEPDQTGVSETAGVIAGVDPSECSTSQLANGECTLPGRTEAILFAVVIGGIILAAVVIASCHRLCATWKRKSEGKPIVLKGRRKRSEPDREHKPFAPVASWDLRRLDSSNPPESRVHSVRHINEGMDYERTSHSSSVIHGMGYEEPTASPPVYRSHYDRSQGALSFPVGTTLPSHFNDGRGVTASQGSDEEGFFDETLDYAGTDDQHPPASISSELDIFDNDDISFSEYSRFKAVKSDLDSSGARSDPTGVLADRGHPVEGDWRYPKMPDARSLHTNRKPLRVGNVHFASGTGGDAVSARF